MPARDPHSAALFLGYAVKQLLPVPTNFTDNRVTHIASVSDCIAARPPDWVDPWDFNAASLYDTSDHAVAAAKSQLKLDHLVPPWAVFAYAFYPIRFDKYAGAITIDPHVVFAAPLPASIEPGFIFLGYDIVQRGAEREPGHPDSRAFASGFGCSPLSCNGLSREFNANRYCLIDEWEDAFACARVIAIEQPEPGCYYIFGVFVR